VSIIVKALSLIQQSNDSGRINYTVTDMWIFCQTHQQVLVSQRRVPICYIRLHGIVQINQSRVSATNFRLYFSAMNKRVKSPATTAEMRRAPMVFHGLYQQRWAVPHNRNARVDWDTLHASITVRSSDDRTVSASLLFFCFAVSLLPRCVVTHELLHLARWNSAKTKYLRINYFSEISIYTFSILKIIV